MWAGLHIGRVRNHCKSSVLLRTTPQSSPKALESDLQLTTAVSMPNSQLETRLKWIQAINIIQNYLDLKPLKSRHERRAFQFLSLIQKNDGCLCQMSHYSMGHVSLCGINTEGEILAYLIREEASHNKLSLQKATDSFFLKPQKVISRRHPSLLSSAKVFPPWEEKKIGFLMPTVFAILSMKYSFCYLFLLIDVQHL